MAKHARPDRPARLLRVLRVAKNLKQKDLMRQLGIDSKDMYQAEVRGWPLQSESAVATLEQIFGVPMAVLLKPVDEIHFG